MSMLANQLSSAIAYGKSLAVAAAARAKVEAERKARGAITRQKQWEGRKGKPNNIKSALLERLPKTEEEAIPLSKIETLFPDYETCPSGVSSALSYLFKEKKIGRTGQRLSYCYYVHS